jgi:hypothetical protein
LSNANPRVWRERGERKCRKVARAAARKKELVVLVASRAIGEVMTRQVKPTPTARMEKAKWNLWAHLVVPREEAKAAHRGRLATMVISIKLHNHVK